ncbi:MAG: hypothetical protein V1802_02195 [Candidatus Aenigmatarchaeota archaeon]
MMMKITEKELERKWFRRRLKDITADSNGERDISGHLKVYPTYISHVTVDENSTYMPEDNNTGAVLIATSGQGWVDIDSYSERIRKKDIFCIFPGVKYSVWTDENDSLKLMRFRYTNSK